MKKMIVVLMALLLTVVSIGTVVGQEDCVDCCEGDVCYGDEASSPALDVYDCNIEINGRTVKNDVTVLKAYDRGEELEIDVEFVSLQDAEDVVITARISGYHRAHNYKELVFDMTPTFDVEANVSYHKSLDLKLPDDFDLDSGDELKVRIDIEDKFSNSYQRTYNLKIEALREKVIIEDIIVDPSSTVEAGRGVFVSVRLENMGKYDEDSVKITASVPELGLRATEYIDELEADDATTSEDMFIRVPSCSEPGLYDLIVSVEYADGDEEISESAIIEVLADPLCEKEGEEDDEDKTVVTVPGRQDVITGTSGTVFPIIIENRGSTDRTYQLSASGLDSWATYRFDPGTLVLMKAGEMKTVYLYVTPKDDAAPGEKVFMVSVETAGETKQIALSANVVEGDTEKPFGGDWESIKKGLEIGLVVLVVLLVILGLVVGFSKLKGDEDDRDDMSGQTYY